MKNIRLRYRVAVAALGLVAVTSLPSAVQAQRERDGRAAHAGGIERQRAPFGYERLSPPRDLVRPSTPDRHALNHNFTAERGFRVGPYHPPEGFSYRRYRYGEILPPIYWGQNYWLSDYWLFGLDVPPVGFEWVRYGNDALLVSTVSGEVVQVVYDDFL